MEVNNRCNLKYELKDQLMIIRSSYRDNVPEVEKFEGTLQASSWIDEDYRFHMFVYDSNQAKIQDSITVKVRNIYESFTKGSHAEYYINLIKAWEEKNNMNFEMLIAGILYTLGYEKTETDCVMEITPLLLNIQ